MFLRIFLFIGLSLSSALSLAQETCVTNFQEITKNKENLPAFIQEIKNKNGLIFGASHSAVTAALKFQVDDSGMVRVRGKILKMADLRPLDTVVNKICYDKSNSEMKLYFNNNTEYAAKVVNDTSFTMGNSIVTVGFNKTTEVEFARLSNEAETKYKGIKERNSKIFNFGGSQ